MLKGIVPIQWRKVITVPMLETNLPKCIKLIPVTLSDCFAKVAKTLQIGYKKIYLKKNDLQQ